MENNLQLTNIMTFHYRAEICKVAKLRDKIRITRVYDQPLMGSNKDRDDYNLYMESMS